jgi:hypothetical protein
LQTIGGEDIVANFAIGSGAVGGTESLVLESSVGVVTGLVVILYL